MSNKRHSQSPLAVTLELTATEAAALARLLNAMPLATITHAVDRTTAKSPPGLSNAQAAANEAVLTKLVTRLRNVGHGGATGISRPPRDIGSG